MTSKMKLSWTVLAAVVLNGCASASKPTNYYLMSPAAPAVTPSRVQHLAVGVGPVTLTGHLRRQNIVIRTSSTRIHIAPDERWAAPLDTHLSELLAENLRRRLGLASVPTFPWSPATRVDYQITIHITRFIHHLDHVYLDACWRLANTGSSTDTKPPIQRSVSLHASSGNDYDHIVETMSRLAGRLSDEIAKTIRRIDSSVSES